jgi:surface polysaccharide O-acyltransferase-like enzyme
MSAQKAFRTRDFGFDLARVVATILVVMLHVSGRYFGTFGPNWTASNIYDSLTRLSVPLFFMISGALLIPRQDQIRSILSRFGKLLLLLIFWSSVYLLLFYFSKPNWLDHGSWQILKGPIVVHFWFLYALLGLYLFLPVLQAFYRIASPQAHCLYLGLTFIGASLLPFLQTLGVPNPIGIDLRYFPIYAGYMMAGAVLCKATPGRLISTALLSLCIASSLATAWLTAWMSSKTNAPSEAFYVYESPLTVIASICGFLSLRGFGAVALNASFRAAVSYLAPLSFGIYVLHFALLYGLIQSRMPDPSASAWWAIPAATICIFAIAAIAVLPLWFFRIGRLLIHA